MKKVNKRSRETLTKKEMEDWLETVNLGDASDIEDADVDEEVLFDDGNEEVFEQD